MIIVVSLGGSVITPPEHDKLDLVAGAIKKIAKKNMVFVVVGGGKTVKEYIRIARGFGSNEVCCDLMGIDGTRMNARLLIAALSGSAYPDPPCSYQDAKKVMEPGKVIVMGGVSPGYTTDAVAAILSEYVGAGLLIKATSIDGVYDSDPTKNPNAKKLQKITPEQLVEIAMKGHMRAGSISIMDPVGAKIIERCRIRTIVVDGTDPENIVNAVRENHNGTEVIGKDCS
ncbi:MAG: UMP kinase [Halobacteriota archaeon]|nr:UMP kinase [Halobacteriota archaeon]